MSDRLCVFPLSIWPQVNYRWHNKSCALIGGTPNSKLSGIWFSSLFPDVFLFQEWLIYYIKCHPQSDFSSGRRNAVSMQLMSDSSQFWENWAHFMLTDNKAQQYEIQQLVNADVLTLTCGTGDRRSFAPIVSLNGLHWDDILCSWIQTCGKRQLVLKEANVHQSLI